MNAYYQAHNVHFKGHNGIDFAAPHGFPIRASHDGLANYEVDSAQGHGVTITTTIPMDGQFYFKSIYWHMCDPIKEPQFASPIRGKKDVPVKTGDIIGYQNSTGLSTGDHLHFGLKKMLKDANGNLYNAEPDNGYYGATDPNPYFTSVFAENYQPFRFTKDLYYGSSGTDVYRLQKFLVNKLYGDFTPTGFFGAKTLNAVIKYQKTKGITPSAGYVGPITRSYLNKEYAQTM